VEPERVGERGGRGGERRSSVWVEPEKEIGDMGGGGDRNSSVWVELLLRETRTGGGGLAAAPGDLPREMEGASVSVCVEAERER
jgi:hypothetical protein